MKKLRGRAAQKGAPLDAECKKAKISRYEYGPEDNRKFCYGLYEMSSSEILEKCRKCGAYVCNAGPIED